MNLIIHFSGSFEISVLCVCLVSRFSYVHSLWPMDCSPPGSCVYGILQARILEKVAMTSSRGSSWLWNWTLISCLYSITGGFLTRVTRETHSFYSRCLIGIIILQRSWIQGWRVSIFLDSLWKGLHKVTTIGIIRQQFVRLKGSGVGRGDRETS